ncbi:hypothetical protein [Vibrio jasicida]|uniref:hypothetical protein n=1 Tax=Vibrio jasicida TaxID=766224 RepID=UPI0005EF5D76|nr:hypothetical protein [Vibrio jasicida]
MIFKDTDQKLTNRLKEIEDQCLSEIDGLNAMKNKVLKEFLKEFLETPKPVWGFTIGEVQAIWSPYEKKMKSIGGQISGQSRYYKSKLAMYFLTILTKQNKEYFKYYTSLNYQMYSKFVFNTAPTKKTLLPLINNEMDWQKKNEIKPQYKNKAYFESYLNRNNELKEDDRTLFMHGFDDDECLWELSDSFLDYYAPFREEIKNIKDKYAAEYKKHREEIDAIFNNVKDEPKNEKE